MNRLIYLALALLVGGVLVAPAVGQEKPFPGTQGDGFLYVDVVNSPRPKANKPRPKSCTQINAFRRGERPVWRIWGVHAPTGAVLSPENVQYAYIRIPGATANVKLNWGPLGAGAGRSWFWTAGWDIPVDYPLGVVVYRVVFKTDDGKFVIYTEEGLPDGSRMTVLPQS